MFDGAGGGATALLRIVPTDPLIYGGEENKKMYVMANKDLNQDEVCGGNKRQPVTEGKRHHVLVLERLFPYFSLCGFSDVLRIPTVLATPHIGFVEKDSYELYFRAAFQNIVDFAAGTPKNLLNPDALNS